MRTYVGRTYIALSNFVFAFGIGPRIHPNPFDLGSQTLCRLVSSWVGDDQRILVARMSKLLPQARSLSAIRDQSRWRGQTAKLASLVVFFDRNEAVDCSGSCASPVLLHPSFL